MPTEKELADAYRLVEYDAFMRDADDIAGYARTRIDRLDPPKPTWADGTYAWVPGKYGRRHLCRRSGGKWIDSLALDGSVTTKVSDDNVTGEVEPLRVLGDDEIALPRMDLDTAALRDLADCHDTIGDPLPRMSINARQVVRFYAAALDAEARAR